MGAWYFCSKDTVLLCCCLAAYSDPKIRRVYAFDPSMVTGYYSVDPRTEAEALGFGLNLSWLAERATADNLGAAKKGESPVKP
jgi:hypothetical protein